MRQIYIWSAATLTLAAMLHIIGIIFFPNLVMMRLTGGVAGQVGPNTILHAPRATAESRTVVRPSPDLVYSLCAFDVSKGPVRFTAQVPADTYWSFSAFDAKTNNFFVVNDQQIQTETLDIILAASTDDLVQIGNAPIVLSPSTRGVGVFRTLIISEDRFEEIDAIRRTAKCAPVAEE